eukprot:TRINITY_DN57269_c0_g1_i1.p1 TRINITY_DN57269_c0_g1~~TRINITY_DN57269_c0_g1_i1.p1  ORF type:complete len:279 (-),score=27.37 TRINITY_DN57269_c0_g1_i1:366-1121(-)
MESKRLVLGCSLLETATTISVIATLNRFSLVFMASPVALASLCRTAIAVSHLFRACSESVLVGVCALSVGVLVYCILLARNSSRMLSSQDSGWDEALPTKAAILFACALGSAFVTSLSLYTVLKPFMRSAVTRSARDVKKAGETVLSVDDATLRTFVYNDAETLAHDVDGDLAHADSCSVCLEDFVSGEVICKLVCHHDFHRICIEGWVSSLNSRSTAKKAALCPLRCGRTSKDTSTTHIAALPEVAMILA